MSEKITCEDFNALLTDFALGRLSAEDAAGMKEHISSCEGCREVFEIKKVLVFDPLDPKELVPDSVAKSLTESVLEDVATVRESGRRRSWASRYLMPAMAAAIIVFVFLTGFMLVEIRHLHSENSELRDEAAVMKTALAHAGAVGTTMHGGRSVFGRLTGSLQPASGGMTIGEATRILNALPVDTPVLTEQEAERLISKNHRLRRLAGYLDDKPWEGGLTSGELLLMILALDIDPEARIPDEWRASYGRSDTEDEI